MKYNHDIHLKLIIMLALLPFMPSCSWDHGERRAVMPTFTVNIDDTLDKNLKTLKKDLGQRTKAETFRLALALLKIAADARRDGLKMVIADKDNEVKQEIVLPI